MASRQGLKHAILLSPRGLEDVASGMASRQGLKPFYAVGRDGVSFGRQWNGFPSGIETSTLYWAGPQTLRGRQWNGFPSGIETPIACRAKRDWKPSPVEWLPVRD